MIFNFRAYAHSVLMPVFSVSAFTKVFSFQEDKPSCTQIRLLFFVFSRHNLLKKMSNLLHSLPSIMEPECTSMYESSPKKKNKVHLRHQAGVRVWYTGRPATASCDKNMCVGRMSLFNKNPVSFLKPLPMASSLHMWKCPPYWFGIRSHIEPKAKHSFAPSAYCHWLLSLFEKVDATFWRTLLNDLSRTSEKTLRSSKLSFELWPLLREGVCLISVRTSVPVRICPQMKLFVKLCETLIAQDLGIAAIICNLLWQEPTDLTCRA